MKGCSVLALAIVVLVVGSNLQVHAITCKDAVSTLMPCKTFLVGGVPKPAPTCCPGVQKVSKASSSPGVRKTLCECFKKTAPAMKVRPDRAKQLPGICGVTLTIPVDPNVDCSKLLA